MNMKIEVYRIIIVLVLVIVGLLIYEIARQVDSKSESLIDSKNNSIEESDSDRVVEVSLEEEEPKVVEKPVVEDTVVIETDPLFNILKEYKPSISDEKAELLAGLAEKYGEQFNIDPVLIVAFMWQESRFDSKAVSSHGAVGLMQILPSTAKPYGVTRNQLFDIETNVGLGVEYLAYLIDYFNDERLGVIAYNQGMGNVMRGTYRTWYYEQVYAHYQDMLELTVREVQ